MMNKRLLYKGLCFLAVTALLIGSLSVMVFAADTTDVRTMLKGMIGARPLSEEQRRSADLDGDGSLSAADVRLLLFDILGVEAPVTTQPAITTAPVSSTRPTEHTTVPVTLTTTGYDCISTTTYPTTTSTVPTTYPTTLPYGDPLCFTAQTVTARAGHTFDLDFYVSKNHCLVGFELDILFDPASLTLLTVSENGANPYASNLNTALFNDEAQWRFTALDDGTLNVRYVSSASSGDTAGGRLFTLRFLLDEEVEERPIDVSIHVTSHLSSVNWFEYCPAVYTQNGVVKVASRTTRPKTTTGGPTDPSYPPTTYTTETYPPTTTSTWILTGPDGTTVSTFPPTTDTTYVLTGTTLTTTAAVLPTVPDVSMS